MSEVVVPQHRLKICFVQPVQSPYWTERLRTLANNENLEITLLLERTTFAHRPGWAPETIDGVAIEVLGSSVVSSVRRNDDLGYRVKGVRSIPWRMLFALWRIRPDVTVMCNATQTLLALPIKWLSVGRLALIVEDTSHAMRNLGFLKRWTKGWLYRRVDCCFAFSEDAINYLAQVGIVHGVKRSSWSLDMNSFRPRSFEGLSQAGARETKSEKTIIFIGQLIQRKGVMLLLQAWLELSHETRQRCKLLLVGDGYMRTEMQEFINNHDLNNVNILGHIPYNKVKYLLSSADLLVLPTLEDLFSLTVVEAMASGCAVITTPFAGARELINIEETGWIVDPTVPEALTKTLQHALSEQTDLRRMGLAARARVEEMDNIKVMAEFAQALRQLAGAA